MTGGREAVKVSPLSYFLLSSTELTCCFRSRGHLSFQLREAIVRYAPRTNTVPASSTVPGPPGKSIQFTAIPARTVRLSTATDLSTSELRTIRCPCDTTTTAAAASRSGKGQNKWETPRYRRETGECRNIRSRVSQSAYHIHQDPTCRIRSFRRHLSRALCRNGPCVGC